jgi:hypothetical protein
LCNIFIEHLTDYIGGGSAYAPVVGVMSFPGLLFAYSLAVSSFAVNDIQKGTVKVLKYGGKGTE